jgi:hypothetical protein
MLEITGKKEQHCPKRNGHLRAGNPLILRERVFRFGHSLDAGKAGFFGYRFRSDRHPARSRIARSLSVDASTHSCAST